MYRRWGGAGGVASNEKAKLKIRAQARCSFVSKILPRFSTLRCRECASTSSFSFFGIAEKVLALAERAPRLLGASLDTHKVVRDRFTAMQAKTRDSNKYNRATPFACPAQGDTSMTALSSR